MTTTQDILNTLDRVKELMISSPIYLQQEREIQDHIATIVKGGVMRCSDIGKRLIWLHDEIKRWNRDSEEAKKRLFTGGHRKEDKEHLSKILAVIRVIRCEICRILLWVSETTQKDRELDISITIHPKFQVYSKDVKEDLDCSICFESLSKGYAMVFRTDCNHFFHAHCILAWKEKTCPLCRNEYSIEKIV